jgi:hypothetical protein
MKTTNHSSQCITYRGPHGGGYPGTITVCLACAESHNLDHGGYTVEHGLHRDRCHYDPREVEERTYREEMAREDAEYDAR